MSVRVGDRGQGRLEVLNKARILKRYTLALLKNDKYFPKSVKQISEKNLQFVTSHNKQVFQFSKLAKIFKNIVFCYANKKSICVAKNSLQSGYFMV